VLAPHLESVDSVEYHSRSRMNERWDFKLNAECVASRVTVAVTETVTAPSALLTVCNGTADGHCYGGSLRHRNKPNQTCVAGMMCMVKSESRNKTRRIKYAKQDDGATVQETQH
jgi:hypothetical protein